MRGVTPHALKLPEVNHARRLSLDPARFRGLMVKTAIWAGRMASLSQLTIELEEQLADQLRKAAREHGWTPETLAADCVAQHLEIAVRHRVVIERMEAVDADLAALATFVGEATQSGEGVDLTKICRYGRESRKPD